MSNEKYRTNWVFKKQIGIDLLQLANGGSVNGLVSDLLEDAIENRKRIAENKSIDRDFAELKVVESINSCVTISHLKSALTYINLFNLAYGSSKAINRAYEVKKELLIN